MGKIGDLWIRLGLKSQELKTGLDDASRQTDKFASKSEKAGTRMQKAWAGVIGKIAGLGLAFKALRDGFKTIADFEQANANLATILGKSVGEIKDMTDSALELGRTTSYTASQVTELQTELAKLGFSTDQIKAMQKPVLDFAVAVGTDLASASAFAGSTLRAFGLDCTQTENVLDVLATGTTKSALSFSYLQTAMSIVAPVAKTFGFSLEDTTSLLGTLANAGFDASSASTALRNILLNLANSNGKLAKSLGHNVTNIDELLDGLVELKNKGVDLNTTLALTDKRSVSAFNTFLEGAEATRALRSELEEVGGTSARIASERLDTTSGSIQLMKSAWEGFVLSLSNSKGIIKGVIDTLTGMLGVLTRLTDKTARNQFRIEPYLEEFQEGLTGGMSESAVTEWAERIKKGKGKRERGYIDEALKQALNGNIAPETSNLSSLGYNGVESLVNGGETDLSALFGKKKKGKKSKEKTIQELAKETAEAEEEIRKADAEVDAIASELIKTFEAEHGLDGVPKDLKEIAEIAGKAEAEVVTKMESQADALEKQKERIAKVVEEEKQLAEEFKGAVTDGFAEGVQTLMDGLMGLGDVNAGDVLKALLDPLADMAIQQGKLVMAQGLAIDAIKKSLSTLNGAGAIVAGGALIAVGTAVKSGFASLANSMGVASASSSTSAVATNPVSTSVSSQEFVVKVEGRISGNDILISGQRTKDKWKR